MSPERLFQLLNDAVRREAEREAEGSRPPPDFDLNLTGDVLKATTFAHRRCSPGHADPIPGPVVLAEAQPPTTELILLRQRLQAKRQAMRQVAHEHAARPTASGLARLSKGGRGSSRQLPGLFIPPEGAPHRPRRRIAIDVLSIVPGVSGGVEVYMRTLVRAIQAMPGHDAVLICRTTDLDPLRTSFGSTVGYYHFPPSLIDRMLAKVGRRNLKALSLAQLGASFAFLQESTGANVLHSPVQIFSCVDHDLPAVLNLHDLQHKHHPENFTAGDLEARDRLYAMSAGLADMVIATSEFVANDVERLMGVPREKIRVVPAAWSPDLKLDPTQSEIAEVEARHRLPENYIFYPGQFWKHKNQSRLVAALLAARRELPAFDLHLVLTGFRGHSGWPDVERTIQETGLQTKVVCLDYVPASDLPALYKRAMATIVTSLFEASSYPVIEAQVMGCPAACSRVTSLPELMEDGAGLLFDPLDTADIARAIVQLCSSPKLREEIVAKAFARVRREHTLSSYAQRVQAIYDTLHPLPR
jgi:glycosyltransferase involved in cell wall biosynthesis